MIFASPIIGFDGNWNVLSLIRPLIKCVWMLKMCLMNFVCKIPNGKWLGLSNWVFATLPPWTAIVNGWWWFGQWTLIWIFYARTEGSIEMAVGKWNNLNRKSDRCYFGLKNNILIFAAQTTIKKRSKFNFVLQRKENTTEDYTLY